MSPISSIEVGIAKSFLKHLKPHFTGSLDGKPFAKVSTDAAGKRFVIKGFVDIKKGPAIRFSAPWGQLGDGFAWYLKAGGNDWEDVDEKVTANTSGLTFTLNIKFTASDGSHTAIFKAAAKP